MFKVQLMYVQIAPPILALLLSNKDLVIFRVQLSCMQIAPPANPGVAYGGANPAANIKPVVPNAVPTPSVAPTDQVPPQQ